jgi:hypothetical protein
MPESSYFEDGLSLSHVIRPLTDFIPETGYLRKSHHAGLRNP